MSEDLTTRTSPLASIQARRSGTKHRPFVLALLLLAAAVVLVWLPVTKNDFVSYDDDRYVTANVHVLSGLSGPGVLWAATAIEDSNWIPLTWISHMLDVELFGTKPAGHHAVSLLLHTLTALLLFRWLFALSGSLWPSLCTALLFAVHPLRVESVAWVAERKDVLSGFFGVLTLLAYLGYVRRTSGGRLVAVVLLFAASLMAKPMLVTLPLVLLLLDYWPLGRLGSRRAPRPPATLRLLLLEKLPLVLMALAAGIVALIAQRHGGALGALDAASWGANLAQAVTAAALYLVQLAWPLNLAVFYPRAALSAWSVVAAGGFLLGTTALCVWRSPRSPYLITGWLWYLIMLLPVAGLIPIGAQSMADRYTYLPLIGVFLLLSFGTREVAARLRLPGALVLAPTVLLLLSFSLITRWQIGFWRNSETLFTRAVDVTRENWLARNNLAVVLLHQGRARAAFPHLVEALKIRPDYASAYANLGIVYSQLGDQANSMKYLQQAIRLDPRATEARFTLGMAYLGAGDWKRARAESEALRQLDPGLGERLGSFIDAARKMR